MKIISQYALGTMLFAGAVAFAISGFTARAQSGSNVAQYRAKAPEGPP